MARENLVIDIICPQCNRYVSTYKGWGWTGISAKCKKCNQLVSYDVNSDEFKIIKTPDRTSAGVTFY